MFAIISLTRDYYNPLAYGDRGWSFIFLRKDQTLNIAQLYYLSLVTISNDILFFILNAEIYLMKTQFWFLRASLWFLSSLSSLHSLSPLSRRKKPKRAVYPQVSSLSLSLSPRLSPSLSLHLSNYIIWAFSLSAFLYIYWNI